MTIKEIIEVIPNYFDSIVSWPAVFFVVALIFILKFKYSIGIFLENIASIKLGPFEASQRQVKIPEDRIEDQLAENLQEQGMTLSKEQIQQLDEAFNDLSKERETKEQEIINQAQVIKILGEKAELYEFAYLSLYLVDNSKRALSWFYFQPNSSSTQGNFFAQFSIPAQIINIAAEKEAILNALLVNGLIEQNGVIFKVSDKGGKFLKSIKYI